MDGVRQALPLEARTTCRQEAQACRFETANCLCACSPHACECFATALRPNHCIVMCIIACGVLVCRKRGLRRPSSRCNRACCSASGQAAKTCSGGCHWQARPSSRRAHTAREQAREAGCRAEDASSVSDSDGSWCLLDGRKAGKGKGKARAPKPSRDATLPDVASMSSAQRKALMEALRAFE